MRDDERRLKKLHTELEPREIFLLWLNEVQEFPSMEDYVRRLMKQPDSSYPLVKMPQMVKDAAEEALKGRSREEIFAAIRRGRGTSSSSTSCIRR
ncbi:MAG: hypothetical protein M5U22_02485 [Thermoleophilia bacterium]|nr:hypothetical protein [Thermoleophilia bacterium]